MGHTFCPTCRMEALRLTSDGKHCDWCRPSPQLGKPFDSSLWPSIVATLQQRIMDRIAEDTASLDDRVCAACESSFRVPKSSRARTCSKECSYELINVGRAEREAERWAAA